MVAINKQVGFFTDAYTMEWAYIKSRLIREVTAKVLAERVEEGRYTKKTALDIAASLLSGTATELFGLK